jgi:PilZ domain
MSAAAIVARAAGRLQRVSTEQRSHQRYPIELEMEYRLLNKGRAEHFGSGKTRNISSGGVLFVALGAPPAGSSIELMLSWPFLLEGVCPLRLVMRGRIVRSDVRGVAIQSSYHEFRTAGTRVPKDRPSNVVAPAK